MYMLYVHLFFFSPVGMRSCVVALNVEGGEKERVRECVCKRGRKKGGSDMNRRVNIWSITSIAISVLLLLLLLWNDYNDDDVAILECRLSATIFTMTLIMKNL